MTDEEFKKEEQELKKYEGRIDNLPKDIQKRLIRYVAEKSRRKNNLEKLAREMSERQFMMLLEFDDSWTIEEKLEYYHKHND